MSGYCRSTVVYAVLSLGFLLSGSAHAQTFTATEYPVTQTPAWETTPRLGNDGVSDIVVYTSRSMQADGTLGRGDIWYQRLQQGQPLGEPVQVTSGTTDNQLNDISGDYIVYTAYLNTGSMAGQIMLYQISTKLSYSIGSAIVIQEPRICGTKVVWIEGAAAASEVMLYDLSWLGTAMNAIVIAGPIPPASQVEIGDRFITWVELSSDQLDLVAFDLDKSVRINLTSTPTTSETQPSTSGPWITWHAQDVGSASARVLAKNMDTGELRTVVDNGRYNTSPTIDGDLITWEALQSTYREIYVYRLSTKETFQVTADGIDHYLNDVFGNEVTYADQRTGNEDIYVSVLKFGQPPTTDSCTFLPGIVGCYPFQGDTKDYSSNGYDGVLQGAAGSYVGDKFGNPNGAIALNGVDNYISVENLSGAFDLSEFTIAAIVKAPAVQDDNWIVSKGQLFGNYSLYVFGQGEQFWPGYATYVHQVPQGNWSAMVSNDAVPVNKFFHLAVTLSPTEYRAYVNGILQTTIANPPPPLISGDHLLIGGGGYYDVSSVFQGAIDDLRIYNRALTPDEMKALYNKTFNAAPVAEAGPDQALTLINSKVTLDGSGSYDDDNDPLTYNWQFVQIPAGSKAVLDNPASQKPSFIADAYGSYVVQLTVSDPWTTSKPATVTVSFQNLKPVAEAGGNQSVTAYDTVVLNGSGSYDPNGDTITYLWSLTSKPAGSSATISNATSPVASFVPDEPGIYVAQLIVNDGHLNSDPDTATITATATVSDVITLLNQAITTINRLDRESFQNKIRRDMLTIKISIAILMIDFRHYAAALDLLQNDILGKTDGCATIGSPDNNDWILSCAAQNQVYPQIIKAIELLRLM